MSKKEKKTNRSRFCPSTTKADVEKAIRKASSTSQGIDSYFLENHLCKYSNFLGCFAQDELCNLYIKSFPIFLIVNFDFSYSKGTHWVALRIDNKNLEIWDPLGFNTVRWPSFPFLLLDFIHKYSQKRKILLCDEIQPNNSTLCGFYCIFFIMYRSCNTFSNCKNYFSARDNNDLILTNFFK